MICKVLAKYTRISDSNTSMEGAMTPLLPWIHQWSSEIFLNKYNFHLEPEDIVDFIAHYI